jgi:hypothetical protein
MLISELKKDETYIYIDKKMPLKFSGRTEDRNQYNTFCKIAIFEPIKTETNKNWIAVNREVTIAFSEEPQINDFENFYVKPLNFKR